MKTRINLCDDDKSLQNPDGIGRHITLFHERTIVEGR